MRIEDSVFLITGGGSGLGLASARELVAQGARGLLLDINAEAGAKAAAELGERARFLRADISSEADGRAAVEEALQAFGAVHGLVNCAGVAPASTVIHTFAVAHLQAFSSRLPSISCRSCSSPANSSPTLAAGG